MNKYIDKILFLKKSNASLKVIFSFTKTKIINFILKKKIKKFKNDNKNFLKSKKIIHDYFSAHTYHFYSIIKKQYKIENILEIGSFEGNSSMFLARNLKNSKIYCVDNWKGTNEYNNLDFKSLENNFDENLSSFNNIYKNKCSSDEFFLNNNLYFDLIYIDGHHKADQVTKDFKNSWKFLNKDGVLIFDDYIWEFYKNIKDNPCYAINSYLNELKNKHKILKVTNSQLFIKKI